MKKSDFFAKLKNPGVKVLVFVVYPAAVILVAGAIACVAVGYEGVWTYFLFAGAAVMLCYSVYTLISTLCPRVMNALKESALRHKFTGDFVRDYGFRTLVFACVSFAINAAYALYEGALGIAYHSVWRGCLAAYYIILTVMRGVVLLRERSCRKRGESEREALLRRVAIYGACGASLVVLDFVMCVAVTLMIMTDNTIVYPGLTIFFSAAYTFYKIITASVNFSKAKKSRDPVVQSLRNINLADGMVSVIALETAMLATFGTQGELMPLRAITGFGVCAVTVTMGIFMMVRARKERKRIAAGMGTTAFSILPEGCDALVYAREFREEKTAAAVPQNRGASSPQKEETKEMRDDASSEEVL